MKGISMSETPMKTIDYEKVETAYAEHFEPAISRILLKSYYTGKRSNERAVRRIKEIILDSNGDVKDEFLTIDYSAVTEEINKRLGSNHKPAYVKGAHTGYYNATGVRKLAEEITGVAAPESDKLEDVLKEKDDIIASLVAHKCGTCADTLYCASLEKDGADCDDWHSKN
jgi:hypothetical protein